MQCKSRPLRLPPSGEAVFQHPRLFEHFALQRQSYPRLLFYVWCQHPGVCRHPLLRAVLNFFTGMILPTYRGRAFERQLVALWRQLSVADGIWRRSPVLHRATAKGASALRRWRSIHAPGHARGKHPAQPWRTQQLVAGLSRITGWVSIQ